MSEKHWYQDEGNVLFILFVAGFAGFVGLSFYWKHLEDSKPQIMPVMSGKLTRPLLGTPTLEVTVWHQHPAALRNVQLHVNLNEDPARGEEHWDRRQHSFESWPPNRDQAATFSFPLKQYDPKREITVGVIVMGKSIKLSGARGTWLGDTWKSNKE